MNTYTKILFTTLPLVFFFLIATAGTTYYFSRSALLDLGETWLDTRLAMALDMVETQETILHEYGLETITASIAKAKLDAISQIRDIRVGRQGYIFAVNHSGTIVFHPNKYLTDTDMSQEPWFAKMTSEGGRLFITLEGRHSLARFEFFPAWNWYVLAVDPMDEVYGVSNRMRPYLCALIICAALITSLALMLLTRQLTRPLKNLVRGAEDIGKGNLETRIEITSDDEFGHLAKEFNQMAFRLQDTLTALRYSEEHFRALIENASDLIWIFDKEGNFLYVSPSTERILGYPPQTLLGKNGAGYVHPHDLEEIIPRFKLRTQALIQSQPMVHRFRHKEGYWCTLESISKNLLDHPAISGMVINSRNITKRRQAEEALKNSHQELEIRVEERTRELRALNKALNNEILIRREKEKELERANQTKSNFLANVSHEIRTPLNSVIGFSELLSTMITEKQQAGYLAAVTTAGKNLLALINDILDLSRMEAGKLQINRVPVSLERLFNEIFHLFKVKVEKKNLAFPAHLAPDIPDALFLDEIRLRQVITNLIDNAVKFTEAGSITLKAEANPVSDGTQKRIDLHITVEDTGIGIPENKREIIFESFRQESAGTSRKFGGTGLGLAICRQLTELMGGGISVDGAKGGGSIFTIRLPGVEISRGKMPEPAKPRVNLNKIQFSGETVLVVDDQHDIRFLLRELLGKLNLGVIEAENGQQAVEKARAHMPAIIFMDAKMPVLNGIDAAARLKADPATGEIPVCCMTASMHASFNEDFSRSDFSSCLTKPIVIEELMQVLTRHLSPCPVEKTEITPGPEPAHGLVNERLSPELTQRLKTEILPHLPALQDAMKISDIRNFAREINKLAAHTAHRELAAFGEDLFHQAETFDIENIRLSLKQFSDMLAD
ncbi:MAG: PAS domain S-box protein [Desulfobacter sp.]|nr:MAG: PAS domain S-box protein [Desulfobacter sp.]